MRRFDQRASARRWPRCVFPRAGEPGRSVAEAAKCRRNPTSRLAHRRDAGAQLGGHLRELPPLAHWRCPVAPGGVRSIRTVPGKGRGGGAMLSRREFGGGLAAAAAVRRRGSDHTTPAPQPVPANEPNLARILRTKRLRIAGLVGEEPYSYKDPATGQWGGFWLTMTRNLAMELGVEVVVVESSWPNLPADLQASKIDLCYLSPTAQRGMFVDFANSLFYDTYAIVARKGFAPMSWAELDVAGSLVAVDIGSAREET